MRWAEREGEKGKLETTLCGGGKKEGSGRNQQRTVDAREGGSGGQIQFKFILGGTEGGGEGGE